MFHGRLMVKMTQSIIPHAKTSLQKNIDPPVINSAGVVLVSFFGPFFKSKNPFSKILTTAIIVQKEHHEFMLNCYQHITTVGTVFWRTYFNVNARRYRGGGIGYEVKNVIFEDSKEWHTFKYSQQDLQWEYWKMMISSLTQPSYVRMISAKCTKKSSAAFLCAVVD